MAGSLNRVTLIGNVGRDPESKSFNNGGKVVNLSLATAESWKDKQTGERKEKTEWHNVAVFQDGLTGIVESYVRKGSRIMVEGKLQTRKWQDQNGNDRYSTEIVLQGPDARVILLDGKQSEGGGNRSQSSGGQQRAQSGGMGGSFGRDDLDDDLPF